MHPNTTHPLTLLHRKIKQSCKEFRHSNDNSFSLFNPRQGFTAAYEIAGVHKALEEYEQSLRPARDLQCLARKTLSASSCPEARKLAEAVLQTIPSLAPRPMHEKADVVIIDWDEEL